MYCIELNLKLIHDVVLSATHHFSSINTSNLSKEDCTLIISLVNHYKLFNEKKILKQLNDPNYDYGRYLMVEKL